MEIHSPSGICSFWSQGAAPEEETRHGRVQVEIRTSGDAKPVLTNGANVCEMVLTFFCMNQVVFALLYCGSFQHCVQIKEKMPREDAEWILSPPPFTLQDQHFLPSASFKLSHQGTPEQTGQPTTLQGQGASLLCPSSSGRFARHSSACSTSRSRGRRAGGSLQLLGPLSTAQRLGRDTGAS